VASSLIPSFKYVVPEVNHKKNSPYRDFPVVYEDTVTQEAFYVDHNFTLTTSDFANTTLYKWNGVGYTEVTGWSNPEYFYGKGFYAVTTAADATVCITEDTN